MKQTSTLVPILFLVLIALLTPTTARARGLKSSHSQSIKPGKIIFITGSCSAGKSSLARLVADKLDAKIFAFDDYVMPVILKKFITKTYGKLAELLVGNYVVKNFYSANTLISERKRVKIQRKFLTLLKNGLAHKPTTRMYQRAKAYATKGQNVVIESPLFLLDDVTTVKSLSALEGTDITYVLAYCPWDKLIEHLKKRNLSTETKNHRQLDWILGNYVQYIQPSPFYQGSGYLETIEGETIHRCIAHYDQSLYRDQSFQLANETKEAVLTTFPARSLYYIYPRFTNGIIINTGHYTPAEGAEHIIRTLIRNE